MNKHILMLGVAMMLSGAGANAKDKPTTVSYVVEVRSNVTGDKVHASTGVLSQGRPQTEINRTREVSFNESCHQTATGMFLKPGKTWDGVKVNAHLNEDGSVAVSVDKRMLISLEDVVDGECSTQTPQLEIVSVQSVFSAHEVNKNAAMIVDQEDPITVTVRVQK